MAGETKKVFNKGGGGKVGHACSQAAKIFRKIVKQSSDH